MTGVNQGQSFYERMIVNMNEQRFIYVYLVTTPTYAAAHAPVIKNIGDSLGVIDLSGLKTPTVAAGTTDTPPPLIARPKTSFEQAIKVFTGLDYSGVGSSKYYTTRRTRLTTGDDQFEIRMIYAPTLASNTWGQCSVTFSPTYVQITATRREPALQGVVIVDALFGGTVPVVIRVHMGSDARCWSEMR